MPRRAEQLFQVVVGAGQIRHVVAVEQTWPIALGDLQEVPQRCGQRTACSCSTPDSSEQRCLRAANRRAPTPPRIPENLGRLVHQSEADLHLRPQRCAIPQAAIHQTLPRRQFLAEPPFFPMPSELARMADNRSCSLSPLGRKGSDEPTEEGGSGRPSSVMADRTAEQ